MKTLTPKQIYIKTHGQPKCKTCNRNLGIKFIRNPCEEYPNGLLKIKELCDTCNSKKFNVCKNNKPKKNRKIKQKRIYDLQKTSLTFLHRTIRTKLKLDEYGFESEQNIHPYRVDELNKKKKIIIEINGNYVHGNPKYYKPSEIIIMPNSPQQSVSKKWKQDKKRISYLERKGYKVFVIWEDDDLVEWANKLKEIMQ